MESATELEPTAELLHREAIRQRLVDACWQLDARRFDDWLEGFTADARYEIVAHSPEIDREMRWMSASRAQLAQTFKELRNHVTEDARRAHVAMPIHVEVDGEQARALTRFSVFKTDQQGITSVYAVGHYEDRLRREEAAWRFEHRRVVLDTRMFDVFPHLVPL
ncbi:MAG: nuclear transport factor 2 family protein [Burkholderiaceae bacterium]